MYAWTDIVILALAQTQLLSASIYKPAIVGNYKNTYQSYRTPDVCMMPGCCMHDTETLSIIIDQQIQLLSSALHVSSQNHQEVEYNSKSDN